MTSALYEPLIERDCDAFAPVAHAFLELHSLEELWVAVTRFAVLAYAPSQHAKRAVMACLAAHDALDVDMVLECARYAAESRQPWSEPPILDPPHPSSGEVDELRAAARAGDRPRAERWLSARLADADAALRDLVHCDALLMLDTASGLLPLLGEKGRYALLRMPVWELIADPDARDDDTPLATLIARAVEANGSPDAVSAVFHAATRSAGFQPAAPPASSRPVAPYRLARDYAQTLIAHHYAPRLSPEHAEQLLHAVHDNLQHGDSFADWSFA
ncbi:MAG TPA: hypothetical protein VFP80_05865 [Thermoanaerobaculia bacterium]|nr:hypothetical protein [Thermoanaerobaculia bacterium]